MFRLVLKCLRFFVLDMFEVLEIVVCKEEKNLSKHTAFTYTFLKMRNV